MSQHKAPTAVTIAPIHEKSGLGLWVEKYWKIGAVVVAGLAALILVRANAKHAERTESDSHWGKLLTVAAEDPNSGILNGPPADLRRLAEDIKGSPTGGWALYIGATSALTSQEFEEAEALLVELRTSYPRHALVTQEFRDEEGSDTSTVVERLLSRIEAERTFFREHSSLFENPALPADAPRVRVTTDRGAIVLGLYADLAPKHVENFIKLAKDGFYVGTKFHSIFSGEYVQGGDPNSIDKDPSVWGQGGPDYTLEREASQLRHFAGVISAVPVPGDATKTSGSQFLITTANVHGLDQTHVPFGMVIEGLNVLKEIERAPLAESTFNRPENPVAITSVEVL